MSTSLVGHSCKPHTQPAEFINGNGQTSVARFDSLDVGRIAGGRQLFLGPRTFRLENVSLEPHLRRNLGPLLSFVRSLTVFSALKPTACVKFS